MENARHQLEELDRIEQALVARIRRSSQWLPPNLRTAPRGKSRKLSARECALQRWEAARLVERHDLLNHEYKGLESPEFATNFEAELKQCFKLSDATAAPSLARAYAQRRSSKGRERYVSEKTEHIIAEIDAKYPPEEQWGQILRLEPFYRALLAADEVTIKPETYRDYLSAFSDYADYGCDRLAEYLMQFYDRAFAVGPGSRALDLPLVRAALQETQSDPLFCHPCNHRFANAAVFNAHLSGRKHKRAVLAHKETKTTTFAPQVIRALAQALEPAFASTIADIDRKAAMTLQERRLEVEALEHERQLEDSAASEEEKESPLEQAADPEPTKQLLGPEGTPIPRWLFKLHGLNTTFKCEICQPHAKIAGRTQFERHFRDPKHINSLKLLGITSSEAYKGITTIPDALDLQKALQREPATVEREVEDDEGNIMSEKMMKDLKKQGLL